MVEEIGNQRRTIRDGVEVTVVINEATLDVYITVTPEADISCKHKYEEFTFKFKAENKAKKLEEPVYLQRKRVKYVKGTSANNVKLKFYTKEYRCEISITPKLFVPEEVWKQIEIQRQMRAKNGKNASKSKKQPQKIKLTGGGRSLSKRYRPTPYSKTNIARPYQGGRCTPK